MIKQVISTTFISLGIGYLCHLAQSFGPSNAQYLTDFLRNNIILLLVALLAINSATMGIVLSKIRDMIDKAGGGAECFATTRQQMLLSIKEQVALIIIAAILLIIGGHAQFSESSEISTAYSVALSAIFAYSMLNLYDNAKSVLIIIDHE